jgi:ABC-type antimicrobial peptide transport system permease subunit
MLISWIKQFIRVSFKGRFYTLVNTLGLSIGLGCTIIILLWAGFQQSFDKFHPDYKNIFQLYEIQTYSDGYTLYTFATPSPLAAYLRTNFADVTNTTRFNNGRGILSISEKSFRENSIGFTDSTFFDIFKIDFISGNKNQCFKDFNSIVLTEKLANKLFGNLDVIGQSVRINSREEFMVTAVIKDYPKNSNINFSCLVPFEKGTIVGFGGIDKWGWNSHSTFAVLNNSDEIKVKELAKAVQVETKKIGVGENTNLHFYPLEKRRLYNPDPNDFGYIFLVRILLAVAGFVLLLASINFINLITARAANRAKEVGIRKVVGSSRGQLVIQYFMESFLSTLISLAIAILLVDLALPSFNRILETELSIIKTNIEFWWKILLVVLSVGFFAGIYPALVLSSFQPAKVLKGILRSGAKGAGFRKTMVIIQYTVTILLVVITFFMFRHLSFVINAKTGMSRENVIYMTYIDAMNKNYLSFKDELTKLPGVRFVTGSYHLPFRIGNSTSNVDWQGKDTLQAYLFTNTRADEHLVDAMGISLTEGRFFSSKFVSDTASVVINETAAKIIGKQPIVGENINIWGDNMQVIGVMKDFNFEHFANKIQPLFILYEKERFNFVLLKLDDIKDGKTIEQIKSVFANFYPDSPFEMTYLQEEYQRMFSIESQLRKILGQFTILAIIISSVGLLSLAAFIAEQQRKSLVLRKIHGATLSQILAILLGSYTKWVFISGFIAIPLSYIALKGMFNNYTYHAEFSWWIFASAFISALVIAVLTVLYQALKTALADPVDTLRYE